MEIKKYQFISGSKKAEGLTVIIDVFRAYTTAAYLFSQGAEKIYVVSKIETAEFLRDQLKNPVLIGERKGIKLKGFDYNNSPYFISQKNFNGCQIILSTSAGTKGIINAGKRFFNEKTQSEMPKEDFYYALTLDKFDFIIKAEKYAEDVYKLIKK